MATGDTRYPDCISYWLRYAHLFLSVYVVLRNPYAT